MLYAYVYFKLFTKKNRILKKNGFRNLKQKIKHSKYFLITLKNY